MKSHWKKWLLLAAVLVVVGALVYRSRGSLGISGPELWAAIRGANPLWLGAGLVLIYGCYALRSLRWQVYQRNLGRAKFWEIYPATLAGFSAVYLLGRPGEAIRPVLLAKRANIPVADIFGIWVLERLIDFGCMGVIAAAALLTFKTPGGAGENAKTLAFARSGGIALAVGVAVAFGFLVYLRLHGTKLIENRIESSWKLVGWKAKVGKIILSVLRGIQALRSLSDLVQTVVYSAAHWVLVLVVYYCVSQSFGGRLAELRLTDCILLLALTLVGSIFQLPGAGGGPQAAAIFVYHGIFGVEKTQAFVAAMVLWLVTFAGCAIVGIPLLIREGVSLGQLKEIAEHDKEELDEIAAHGNAGAGGGGEKPA